MSLIKMNVYHLLKAEVGYELRIRGLSAEGNANELRKRLQQSLANNDQISMAAVNALDVAVELEECEAKLQDLSTMVADYEGNFNDNEYHRIVARLWHLYLRTERIPVTAGIDEDEEKNKTEITNKTKELLDIFKDPGPVAKGDQHDRTKDVTDASPKTSPEHEEKESGPKIQVSMLPTLQTSDFETCKGLPLFLQTGQTAMMNKPSNIEKTIPFPGKGAIDTGPSQEHSSPNVKPKYVPVYKWGIKFDNNGSSVAAFLERVEELRRARGVTHSELFESAVDLFSGSALVWYRASTSRIHSWAQLSRELREVFQPPDYDFRLQQEIFNRVQGETEPIDLYLAAMEGLYGRLSIKIPESSRLAQIFNNLHPQLQDRLALFDIKSLDDLRFMGRRAEAGRLRTSRPRPSPRSDSTLEPDLAYQEPHRPRRLIAERVASIHQRSTGSHPNMECWNCGAKGHRFVECRKPRKRFCYGCGKEDTLKKNCTSCRPKNLQSRESAL